MKIKNVIGILVLVAVILAVVAGSVLAVNKKAEKIPSAPKRQRKLPWQMPALKKVK